MLNDCIINRLHKDLACRLLGSIPKVNSSSGSGRSEVPFGMNKQIPQAEVVMTNCSVDSYCILKYIDLTSGWYTWFVRHLPDDIWK